MSSVWAEASGKPLRQCREVSHWLWPLSGPGLALPASPPAALYILHCMFSLSRAWEDIFLKSVNLFDDKMFQ